MHPLSEETVAAHLARRLPPAERAAVSAHLEACPACAALAAGLATWREALAWEEAGEAVPSARPLRAWRPPALAAAALLLTAFAVAVWGRPEGKTSHGKASVETPAHPRLLALGEGAEAVLEAGSRLSPASGAPGAWILSRGACLLFAHGDALHLSAGGLGIEVSEGELLVRVLPVEEGHAGLGRLGVGDAEAAEDVIPAEAWVLSGGAALSSGNLRLALGGGEGAFLPASGVLERRVLPPARAAFLREAFLAPSGTSPADRVRRLGAVQAAEGGWTLDARAAPAAWLWPSESEPYRAVVRVRALEGAPTLGLSFEVAGASTLWLPAEPSLLDGGWHTLGVMVSPERVRLTLDGVPCQCAPRAGFRSNPVAGLSGTGLVVWGGRVEVSDSGSALGSLQ